MAPHVEHVKEGQPCSEEEVKAEAKKEKRGNGEDEKKKKGE